MANSNTADESISATKSEALEALGDEEVYAALQQRSKKIMIAEPDGCLKKGSPTDQAEKKFYAS